VYKLVTAEQMREIEKHTFDLGLASIVVMENAAAATANFIAERFDTGNSVCVICGKGNNGGDGFAVARHLYNKGFAVNILKIFNEISTADARINYDIACRVGLTVTEDTSVLDSCDIIVDAILGIGIKGEVLLPVVDLINKSSAYVVAVDIPTGICSDRGIVCKNAVKADATITFGYKKTGLSLYPGAWYAGEVKVCDISLKSDTEFKFFEPDADYIKLLIPETAIDANKADMGRVFVIAGSPGMTGAAALVCGGALRCGAGLITLAVPKDLNNIMEVKLTEAMTLPLDCNGRITLEEIQKVMPKIKASNCVVIGPGLGKNSEVSAIIEALIKNNIPLIIDADGINALVSNIDILKGHSQPVILTPHPGEFARLCECDIKKVQENRLEMAKSFAMEYNVILVLKGAGTVIAAPDGTCYINPTGNPGMAVGGSGDVLAGVIGALLARGMSAEDSSVAGVYIHGLAGDIAKENSGEDGLIPSDIIDCIPNAILRIKNPEH